MTTDKPIPARRRNVNDGRGQRAGGMPYAELPPLPISQQDAEQEPPAERTFPEPPPPNDVVFTRGPARRPQQGVADPCLQWATGLQTKERRIYAGWLVEVGKHEDLDGAMEQAGFSQVTIKHGGGNLVTHWAIETANVFLVADGVQSIAEMRSTWDRYGVAFGWRTLQGGRMQSHLRCRVLLHELLAAGYAEPLLLTVKGTVTGDLIAALTRQYEVLDAVDAFRKQAGKPAKGLPFYACSIPLGPGPEVSRGSGSTTKEIAPIVANIPTPITREYILAHWPKRAWVEAIESLVDDTIAWSITTSRLIAAGEEQGAAPVEDLL